MRSRTNLYRLTKNDSQTFILLDRYYRENMTSFDLKPSMGEYLELLSQLQEGDLIIEAFGECTVKDLLRFIVMQVNDINIFVKNYNLDSSIVYNTYQLLDELLRIKRELYNQDKSFTKKYSMEIEKNKQENTYKQI